MTETEEQILILLREIKELLTKPICEHDFYQPNSTSVCQQCKKCGIVKY
jgi:hypothetical protein